VFAFHELDRDSCKQLPSLPPVFHMCFSILIPHKSLADNLKARRTLMVCFLSALPFKSSYAALDQGVNYLIAQPQHHTYAYNSKVQQTVQISWKSCTTVREVVCHSLERFLCLSTIVQLVSCMHGNKKKIIGFNQLPTYHSAKDACVTSETTFGATFEILACQMARQPYIKH
jgi:hypothetical protein